MTYLREVAVILKQRFPNLTVDQTIELAEQISVRHTRFVSEVAESLQHPDDPGNATGQSLRQVLRLAIAKEIDV